MELRLLICLLVTIVGYGIANGFEAGEIDGSGDVEPPTSIKEETDDEPETEAIVQDDFDFSGEPDMEDTGSGQPDMFLKNTRVPNMECNGPQCYCVYDNGTKVSGSDAYAQKPDCSPYIGIPLREAASTTKAPLSTKHTDGVPVADSKEEELSVNSPDGDDIVVEYEVSTKKQSKPLTAKPTSQARIQTTSGKDASEEDSYGDSSYNEAVQKDDISVTGLYISHPGILAAIIGGAVVGLLCAILLVMFIIYRMRKKDEGSYPLNDSKPLKDYSYSRAPSKEFYA
ncbi:syndecan-2-like [Watersipora subatra]|uniref:syndecan-2-like n=1 Tax=Watersipora subatra TaxID=2589382 RepID=UPI00355B72F4